MMASSTALEKEISSFKKIIKSVDDGVVALGSTPEAQIDNFVNHELNNKKKDTVVSMEHASLG